MKTLSALMKKDKHLLQALFAAVDETVKKRGEKFAHIRYATPVKNKWILSKSKVVSWDVLDDIAHVAQKRHPHCHRAQIADALSHLINLTDKQLFTLRIALL